jgi:hypothetical protein
MSPKGIIKVGNLKMQSYAAKKPIAIGPDGKFINTADFATAPGLALGSMFALNADHQVSLTLARNKLEPDFKLGIIGVGMLTKDEVLKQVEARTKLGQEIVRAEMNYLNNLIAALPQGEVPRWPPIPPKGPIKPEPLPKKWKWIPKPYWWIVKSWALYCENTTDGVTNYAAEYRIKNVHPFFQARGFVIQSLEGQRDDRTHFLPIAKNQRTVWMSGIGHGSPTAYTGDLNVDILAVGDYDPAEVTGKVIHLLSCQTAKQLGPDLIKNGARAYAGYFENFTFTEDNMDLYWRSDSMFDLSMAFGLTVEQAHNNTITAYNAALLTPGIPGTATATWLTWDRDYFRSPVIDPIYGDKNAKISPWMLLPWHPFEALEELVPAEARG